MGKKPLLGKFYKKTVSGIGQVYFPIQNIAKMLKRITAKGFTVSGIG